jgi:hypothetical protein
MKITSSAGLVKEELEIVWNRSGQLVHDITQLGTNLASLERAAFELARRARDFKPEPERHGIFTVNPAADTSDPRETLAVLKQRLQRIAENLGTARNLLNQSCETIRELVG